MKSQNVARNTTVQNWSKITKNAKISKNREISRFFPTLSASHSKSIASMKVSLHTLVDGFIVNKSFQGHLNWAKAVATVTA